MNKIQNGDFSSGFDSWHNGVGEDDFVLDAGKAKGSSYSASTFLRTYNITQSFFSNEEAVAGKVTVWCKWVASGGNISDGYSRFIVELHKPDTTSVTLLDTTKTAENGEGYLLSGYDIKAHLTQYGTYWLYLKLKVMSSMGESPDPPPPYSFGVSCGWYDNISVDICVRKYKTVTEKIGSAESHFSGEGYTRTTKDTVQLSESQVLCAKKFVMENLGILEDYYVASRKDALSKETFGASELYTKKPKLFRGESFGLTEMHEIVSGRVRHEHEYFKIDESLAFLARLVTAEVTQLSEDYAYHKFKPVYLTREDVGFSETYSAKRIRGNLETTYTPGTPTKWTDIEPPITAWIKIKTEVG